MVLAFRGTATSDALPTPNDVLPLDYNNAVVDRPLRRPINDLSIPYHQHVAWDTRVIDSTPGECDEQRNNAEPELGDWCWFHALGQRAKRTARR